MTGAQGRTEGSVSFSLKELMRLEDERIALEREEARLKREEAARRTEEAERLAHEEAAARAHAEEERRRNEDRLAREEAARLEGIQRALVERERLAAEERTRDAEVRRLQTREIELERLKRAKGGGTSARVAWSVAAASVLSLVACVAVYAAALRPAAEERLVVASAEAAGQNRSLEKAQRQLDELGKRVSGLAEQVNKANARANQLARDLDDARSELAKRGGPPRAPHGSPPIAAPPATPKTGLIDGKCAHKGDPLCTD